MSQANSWRKFDEILGRLAASPAALEELSQALAAIAADEDEAAGARARVALLDDSQRGPACVCVGRHDMMNDLCNRVKRVILHRTREGD